MADRGEVEETQNCDNNSTNEVTNSEVVPQPSEENAGEVNTAEGAAAAQPQQEAIRPNRFYSFLAITKTLILRALLIYFITSFFRKSQDSSTGVLSKSRTPGINMFDNGIFLDVHMYLSDTEEFNNFNDADALFWKMEGIVYGDWYGGPNGDGTYVQSEKIKMTNALKNNGSIYLHVYVTLHGYSPDPAAGKKYAGNIMCHGYKQLNRFKKPKIMKTHNLLTGETALTEEEIKIAEKAKGEPISHWHPNLTVNLITDHTNWVQGTLPPPLEEHIIFLPGGEVYKPAIYMNDFWNMIKDYKPINDTHEYLDLSVTFQPLSLFKWQLYASQNPKNNWASFGQEDTDDDQDSLKEALLEVSPYLLAVTICVSILHSIFELLAFKNDIQFWNNRKSLEGLSVRSVFFNVFQSLIVLLYVLDNDTNYIIRISCFLGLCIEIWKINKVIDIKLNRESKYFGIIPKIMIQDKGSYADSTTREYDIMAFKYLSRAIYPLLICYGLYSLVFQEHKGWYSWILSMFYGFLLTFGFIMMTPQLFINYKLKTVAHLPWRMMTYKALNTFIDDIFAFVIKMPTMYRLGCFRDDIVFFIFLYQKFIYKTDHTRVNEFGFSGDMDEDPKNKTPEIENKETAAIAGAADESEKSAEEKKTD